MLLKKKSKYILLSFLFLFFIFNIYLVGAASPFQTSVDSSGLQIENAVKENIPLNTDYKFHIHVFNSSSGVPIISGVSCYIHLYNLNGSHIYRGYDETIASGFDYEFIAGGNNFSKVGEYHYMTQCNNSGVGGFFAGSIVVNESGLGNNVDNTLLILFFWVGTYIVSIVFLIRKDYIISLVGGLIIMIISVMILSTGYLGTIFVEKNTLLLVVTYFNLAIGMYFALGSGLKIVEEGL